MSRQSIISIPPAYEQAIRFGANWTTFFSPYLILYLITVIALDPTSSDEIGQTLEFAGKWPAAFGATVFLDGLFHVIFFVTVATLFALLHPNWPVRASLLLVCGAWQMVIGFTKALSSYFIFTQLGTAYIEGDTTLRAMLLPVANSEYGLWQAL